MDFSAALTAAKAGKTISRPVAPGQAYVWVTGATTAAGPVAKLEPHLAQVTGQGTLIPFGYMPADVAASDWVAA